MGKLYELIAVEPKVEKDSTAVIKRVASIFAGKKELFTGEHRTLQMFDAERKNEEEGAEKVRELTVTVSEVLEEMKQHVGRHYDLAFQKERSNQTAVADVEIDGKVVIANCPVYFLLGMENRLEELRKVLDSIPILDSGTRWKKAEDLGKSIYRIEQPVKSHKTEKIKRHKVVWEPQPGMSQPPQIETWQDNVAVGTYFDDLCSGAMPLAEKTELLNKMDKLINAVKKARQRANAADAIEDKVSEKIFGYLGL